MDECDLRLPSLTPAGTIQDGVVVGPPRGKVLSPDRADAVGMLATQRGLDPIARAQDSVPRTGAESSPVMMMSRQTVPVS
ncbi:hypothetical protein [Streptomyces sp. NBC_01578]|uniref:hypothetical protein n=1 Tax=Streptomyces sp. NBC_01578 TaxID=2975884 RepID=UPI00386658DA